MLTFRLNKTIRGRSMFSHVDKGKVFLFVTCDLAQMPSATMQEMHAEGERLDAKRTVQYCQEGLKRCFVLKYAAASVKDQFPR